ncbi:hypothetical protein Tco_1245290 [Tanacetum coccineum]
MAPMASSDPKVKTSTYKRGLDTVEAHLVTYRKNEVLFSEEVAVHKREVEFKQYEINTLKAEFEKLKKEKDNIHFKIEKFDKASKDLDQLLGSQISDKSKKGFGYSAVPPPHPLIYNRPNKLDLSYSGLEEFQQPEFEVYGLRANKRVCENSSNETKKNSDAHLIEEWVSDNEDEVESPIVVEKKTVVPIIPKVDVVRPKQQEKLVRKTVRYAEMYRSKGPTGNQRNWNNQKSQQLGNDFVMHNKACYICGSFDHLQYTCKQKRQLNGQREEKPVWKNTRRVNDHYSTRMTYSNPRRIMIPQAVLMRSGIKAVNTAKPKDTHNAVKRNKFNTVKASACWVWMPKNRVIDHRRNNAQIDEDHFGLDECTDSGEAVVQQRQKIMMKGRGFLEQKVNHKFRGGLLGIKLSALSTAKSKTVEGLKTAGYKVSTADSRLLLLVKKLMLLVQVKNRYGFGINISLPEYESFHVDFYNVPSSPRPPEKPPDDDVYFNIDPDTGVLTTKVVDDISDNLTRELYVHVPNVLPTLPTLYPVFDTLLPFSSKNKDSVFKPGILISKEEKFPYLLSHRGFKVF